MVMFIPLLISAFLMITFFKNILKIFSITISLIFLCVFTITMPIISYILSTNVIGYYF